LFIASKNIVYLFQP